MYIRVEIYNLRYFARTGSAFLFDIGNNGKKEKGVAAA